MNEEYWARVRTMRVIVADMLESLTPHEWDAASLCDGWRVRDVAGHLALTPTITTWQLIAAAPRAGFNPNRINTFMARRAGSVPPAQIVSDLRQHAGDRTTAKVLDTRDSLFDVIVHSQDMAVPLKRPLPVPVEYVPMALQRVWTMGWPFNAQRRLAGHTLTAADTEWSVGDGPRIEGTALDLLLLLTGRTSAVADRLQGPGVERLRVGG
jgi:uncharacterized protein (TIGR03083 family)